MRVKALIGLMTVVVLMSCCMVEVEGFGKLKLLKLVKAGLILKALSPKKLLLPLPIPIPIGIHKEHHTHHFGGHQDYHHGGGYHGGYQGGYHGGFEPNFGFGGHHYEGPHGGYGYSSSGYHIQSHHF